MHRGDPSTAPSRPPAGALVGAPRALGDDPRNTDRSGAVHHGAASSGGGGDRRGAVFRRRPGEDLQGPEVTRASGPGDSAEGEFSGTGCRSPRRRYPPSGTSTPVGRPPFQLNTGGLTRLPTRRKSTSPPENHIPPAWVAGDGGAGNSCVIWC